MSNSWKTNGENYVGYSPKTHNPSTTNNNRVIIEGWLKKRSAKGVMWVDRYFKLVGTGLYQYKQKEEGWVEKSHKAFDISNTTLSTRDDYHGAKFCFSIKGIAARTGKKGQKSDGYIFKTKNSIELNQWLEALSTASSHDPNKKKRFVYKSDKDQEEDWDSLVVKTQQYNSGLSSIDILMNGNQKQFSTASKLNNSKDNIGNELYKPSEDLYKPDPSLFEVKTTQSEPLFTQINPTPYANNYLQQQQLQQQQQQQQQLLQQQQQQFFQQQQLQQQQLQQQQQQQQQQPNLQTQQLQQQILQLQLQLQQQQQSPQQQPLQQQQYGLYGQNLNQQPNYQQQQQYGLNYGQNSPQLQHSGSYPNLNLPQVPQHNIGLNYGQNSPQMNHYQYN